MQTTDRFEHALPTVTLSQAAFAARLRVKNSIQCEHITAARHLDRARQFWIQRYQEVGLRSVDDRAAEVGEQQWGDDSEWQANVFVAYRVSEVWLDMSPRGGLERIECLREPDRHKTICGTVTLLTPLAHRRLGSAAAGDTASAGMKVGRITRLAIDHQATGDQVSGSYRSVFLELTGCMHQAALEMGLTHMDAIVHPRHAKLYRRIFNAKPIGDPFACADVQGSPGQYMRADISKPSRFHTRLRDRYEKSATEV